MQDVVLVSPVLGLQKNRTWTGSGLEIPRTRKDRNCGPVFGLSSLRNFEDRLKPVLTSPNWSPQPKGGGHHQQQTMLLMAITITLSTTPQHSPHIGTRDGGTPHLPLVFRRDGGVLTTPQRPPRIKTRDRGTPHLPLAFRRNGGFVIIRIKFKLSKL